MTARRALITGVTGQDGSYLAELLLGKGYEVHGIVRRSSSFNTGRIDHLYQDPHETDVRLYLHYGDVCDASSLQSVVDKVRPDEVYNLAAQSHVRVSFDMPEHTGEVAGIGALRLLEAIRKGGLACRLFQASSSEQFGNAPAPQNEATPFQPRSPYAAAKVFAHNVTANYREAYGVFACNGIMFNHESPRRGETFVTRKITRAVGRIKLGAQHEVYLGNLDAARDWGHARDHVEAMWLMLQAERATDYVIGTGESHTVREFAERAFARAGLDYHDFVRSDPRYLRPTEVDLLRADASKAHRELGWAPKTSFDELVAEMVDADIELAAREQRARG